MNEKPTKLPRTHAPETILYTLTSNESMTFTQLQKILSLSRPALSRHLSKLLDEDMIQYTKKGREKHYSLSKNKPTSIDGQNTYFAFQYIASIFGHIEKDVEEKSINGIYENIEKRISSYFLFLLLYSLKTGKNWYESFDHRRIGTQMINYLLSELFEKEKPPLSSHTPTKEEMNSIFHNMNKSIIEQRKITKLEKMLKQLEIRYPKDVKRIKRILEEIEQAS